MTDRSPELDQGPLWTSAMRLAVAREPTALACWAALYVASVGLDFTARRAGVATGGERLDAAFWTYGAIDALLGAAVAGVALHGLLAGRPPPRLGGGFFAYVGLLAATELYWTATLYLFMPPQGAAAAATAATGEIGARALAMTVLLVAGVVVFSRLLLWPIGRLMGDPRVTPAASWGLMRGYVARYIAASILLALPIAIASVVLGAGLTAGGAGTTGVLAILVARAMDVALTAAFTALAAILYRRRVGLPGGLAEAFD